MIIKLLKLAFFWSKKKPWAGIEPATFALPRQRSGQAELPRHFINKKYEHNLTISIQRYYRKFPGISPLVDFLILAIYNDYELTNNV